MHPHHVPIAQVRGSPQTHTRPPSPLSSSQPQPSSQPPTPTTILCDVCCEHVSTTSLRGCSSCSHRYCCTCVDKFWTGAIYSGNHAHLLCMYGGCGVFASDADVAAVVSHRTFRKMLYFRSRDAFNHTPNARWCAVDLCWNYLGTFPTSLVNPHALPTTSSNIPAISSAPSVSPSHSTTPNFIPTTVPPSSSVPTQPVQLLETKPSPSSVSTNNATSVSSATIASSVPPPSHSTFLHHQHHPTHRPRSSSAPLTSIVSCPRCTGKTCVVCEREVSASTHVHICPSRRANKAHNALFTLWAVMHTKSCPACAARIQRNHGCSHMTCTRCSSYFCWRCKGFLNNGCPLPGRACICDRVMTAAAYSGLAVAGVVGSPVIVAAALLAGPPYLAYRLMSARRRTRGRNRPNAPIFLPQDRTQHVDGLPVSAVTAASAAFTVRERHPRAAVRGILQLDDLLSNDEFDSWSTHFSQRSDDERVVDGSSSEGETPDGTGGRLSVVRSRRRTSWVRSTSATRSESAPAPGRRIIVNDILRTGRDEVEDVLTDGDSADDDEDIPGMSIDGCKAMRPFVLERRRGSVGGGLTVRPSFV